jgi:hypothetical protein
LSASSADGTGDYYDKSADASFLCEKSSFVPENEGNDANITVGGKWDPSRFSKGEGGEEEEEDFEETGEPSDSNSDDSTTTTDESASSSEEEGDVSSETTGAGGRSAKKMFSPISGKTKTFETEVAYASKKTQKVGYPAKFARFENLPDYDPGLRSDRLDRQAASANLVSDEKHLELYESAAKSAYVFPSDAISGRGGVRTLNGERLEGVNPKHLRPESVNYVHVPESLSEVVDRASGNQGSIVLKRYDGVGGKRSTAVYCADDADDQDSPKPRDLPRYDRFLPVCCVDSLPFRATTDSSG